jgi:hypothetical protein
MALHPRDVLRSAGIALVAGVILWPPVPDLLYWSIFAGIGDAVILLVFAASVAAGTGIGTATGVRPGSFAVGGTLTYVVTMGICWAVCPVDSPVHLLVYGVILIGLVLGVGVVPVLTGDSETPTDGEERSLP